MTRRTGSARRSATTLTGALLAMTALVSLSACTGTPTGSGSPTPEPTQPTTPVAAPGGGNVEQTVSAAPAQEPVNRALNETAEIAAGVRVAITKVESITAEAQGPGEVAGPAVAVGVQIINDTAEPLDASVVQVNLTDSAGLPGAGMSGPPAQWFQGTLAAGQRAEGVYVFTVPEANRRPVRVEVLLTATLPVAVFTGDVA